MIRVPSRHVLSCVAVTFILGFSFLIFGSNIAYAGSQTRVSTGFESGWDSSWSATDYNSNSGLDYWGISTYRSFFGTHSLWCAEVGTSSVNGVANNVNHYYDQDMDAWFVIPTGDISTWNSATFSFYVWYVTGSFSLADYLEVANSSDGANYYVLWTQPDVSSSGWQLISFNLPTSTTSIAFIFTSDPTVGFGPYEGVYVDDLSLTVTDNAAPSSNVLSLPLYSTSSIVTIDFSAIDTGGSGVGYTELYYRQGATGPFAEYTTSSNPSGHWVSSPISFDSMLTGGDGLYQFYTVATDSVGNTEAPPAGYDASVTVDTQAPSTSVQVVGVGGTNGWDRSPVTVTLSASDTISGVAGTEYQIDSGSWQNYGSSFTFSTPGIHTLAFNSTDNAGNVEPTQSATIKIDVTNPISSIVLTPAYGPGNGWFVDPVLVNITATDSTSGVSSISYRVDSGAWQPYSGNFTITKEGTTRIDCYSIDNAGNSGAIESTYPLRIDLSPPTIGAGITGTLGANGWYISNVTINATANDSVSGLSSFVYDSWGTVGMPVSGDIVFSDGGPYNVTLDAVDNSGQRSLRYVDFKIDKTAPTTVVQAVPSVVTHNQLTILWTGQDIEGYGVGSGIDHYEMSIDGGAFVPIGNYTNVTKAFNDGNHVVKVRAVDRAGNIGVSSNITFTVDTNAFSLRGPMGPWLDVGIVLLVVALAIIVLIVLRRRKK